MTYAITTHGELPEFAFLGGAADGKTARPDQTLRPNEAAALHELETAVAAHGPQSVAADSARRHLRIMRHFNRQFGF